MSDGRKRFYARPETHPSLSSFADAPSEPVRSRARAAGAALALTVLGLSLAVAAPASAAPTAHDIAVVQSRVDHLYRQAEIASERYNQANEKVARSKSRLTRLDRDLAEQRATVDRMRNAVALSLVEKYHAGDLVPAATVSLSETSKNLLNNLSAVTTSNPRHARLLARYAASMRQLALRKVAVRNEVTLLSGLQKNAQAQKASTDSKAADAKAVLNGLKQKAAEAVASNPGNAVVAASGRAAAAVSFAMAQVGKSYVYGAAGPNAFDCSGLTMMAWAQAGVGLPHSSSAQYSSGPHISESELQPGDLVFYYSPISHVGMYIGGGKIVNALNPGAGIRISGLHDMPYAGAVRPGG